MSDTSKAFKREPAELAHHVLETTGSGDPGIKGFVHHRFWRPFRYSIKAEKWYGIGFSALTVVVIAGGLTSSVLAGAPGNNDVAIAVLGIVVAIAAAVNRLWRPGLRAVVRSRTANSLRREGWNFVSGRGRYQDLQPPARLDVFIDAVEEINVAAEVVDETPVEDPQEN